MVYESRLPAVRLGNDARTKNHFSHTSVRKMWPISPLCVWPGNGRWLTRQHLRFFKVCFAMSKPAKHVGSFEVKAGDATAPLQSRQTCFFSSLPPCDWGLCDRTPYYNKDFTIFFLKEIIKLKREKFQIFFKCETTQNRHGWISLTMDFRATEI